jgi:hypothetical protein
VIEFMAIRSFSSHGCLVVVDPCVVLDPGVVVNMLVLVVMDVLDFAQFGGSSLESSHSTFLSHSFAHTILPDGDLHHIFRPGIHEYVVAVVMLVAEVVIVDVICVVVVQFFSSVPSLQLWIPSQIVVRFRHVQLSHINVSCPSHTHGQLYSSLPSPQSSNPSQRLEIGIHVPGRSDVVLHLKSVGVQLQFNSSVVSFNPQS